MKDVFASWRAEVVFITSNRQGNQEIMEGCKEAGIPAFVSKAHGLGLMTADFVRGHRERCGISDETVARPSPPNASTSKSAGLASRRSYSVGAIHEGGCTDGVGRRQAHRGGRLTQQHCPTGHVISCIVSVG